ncbi:FCD domain-containing protein [Agromyces sp. H3Y2-19a]|uniref:FadR/GntR family transcriptional regulator n=1 Tax=Agromyces chromiiresistens TaxID=3030835 RepID=UPI0023B8CDFF|nr:FCD domain-containing protein [Agromyces chromiiresistens]MDF0512550.1 FCD domain-containing protein [Agromyces chromiiresistens]
MDASPNGSSALHERVIESLGADIVSGRLAPGARILTTDIAERFGASRSALREVVRVLESMGLVEVRRRAGVEILPPERWNPYSTRLIRWRLAGPDRIETLHALSQLRSAVEPLAARLAAEHAAPAQRTALIAAVTGMTERAREADEAPYLEHDVAFHAAVLDASGNPFLAALGPVVGEVLRGRTQHALMPHEANPTALRLHQEVAFAITEGRPDEAERALAAIVSEADQAVQAVADVTPGDADVTDSPEEGR